MAESRVKVVSPLRRPVRDKWALPPNAWHASVKIIWRPRAQERITKFKAPGDHNLAQCIRRVSSGWFTPRAHKMMTRLEPAPTGTRAPQSFSDVDDAFTRQCLLQGDKQGA